MALLLLPHLIDGADQVIYLPGGHQLERIVRDRTLERFGYLCEVLEGFLARPPFFLDEALDVAVFFEVSGS